jgi:hypothetical protein
MAGLVEACPGHPRIASPGRGKQGVDARDEHGHDSEDNEI